MPRGGVQHHQAILGLSTPAQRRLRRSVTAEICSSLERFSDLPRGTIPAGGNKRTMRDRLSRLFARFKERSESEALAVVFDTTAPALLKIAMHLVRDPGEAEDLVQAVFVTAITHASTFDVDRPLMPWLIGILGHHASH